MTAVGASFIVTGASATGKSTLVRAAHELGYRILPTHTTRALRPEELAGVDMISISEAEFTRNFELNLYLEPTLEFALLRSTGTYYGSPQAWLTHLVTEGACAMPTSLTVARMLKDKVSVNWVHLICSPDIRVKRLAGRNISSAEVQARMNSGESITYPADADMVLDTSVFAVNAILHTISRSTEYEQ